MTLSRQLKEIQFSQGMNTKGDHRAQPEQLLDTALNVEFDDIGGLRVRFPFDAPRSNILGGGTLSNVRRMDVIGNELVCFTDTALYSWSDRDSAWVLKGTHLAVAHDETAAFGQNGDQVSCDRAALSGTVVFCWSNTADGGVYVGARSATTGTIIGEPIKVDIGSMPRVVALTTKILLFWRRASSTDLLGFAIDPANFTFSVNTGAASPTTIHGTTFSGAYDAMKVPGLDTAIVASAASGIASYIVTKVTSALALTASTKARTCTGAIAIAVDPTATLIEVIRGNAGNVQGDALVFSSLADSAVNQAIGTGTSTPVDTIVACFQSVTTGGHFRCYCFWTSSGDFNSGAPPVPFETKSNWVDSAGALGTQGVFMGGTGIGAHAFDYNGRTYLWGVFAYESLITNGVGFEALQNTYYLIRDDGLIVGQCVDGRAGGIGYKPSGAQAYVMPGVQLTSGSTTFSWCAAAWRIVPVGTQTQFGLSQGYSGRTPRDVTFAFDDNRARRTAQLGNTLYIAGSIPLQYDGLNLCEVGFLVFTWATFPNTSATAGNIPNGVYSYKTSYRWVNAAGELERSTTASASTVTEANGPTGSINVKDSPLYLTRKPATQVAWEAWRTVVAGPPTGPYYLVTSPDPSVSSQNGYIQNTPSAQVLPTLNDGFSDAHASTLQQHPEGLNVLPSYAPPPANIIFASDTRVFLAGIAGAPNQVWYSKQRNDGEVATFNGDLFFNVPTDGGAITNIGILDGAVIVWCETATYQFAGAGNDNTGGGSNYQLARTLSKDLGCVSQEACTYFDDGFLVKTAKGWFVLDKQLNYTYVGEGAFKYDAETVYAMIVPTKRHQVRVLTSGRMIVFDTLTKNWAESSINDGVDLAIWNGQPAYLATTTPGVRTELATWDGYAGTDYTLTSADVESSWVKFGGEMQARAIVDLVQLLGEFRSSCAIRIRMAKDYEAVSPGVWNYTTDRTWTPSPGTAGSSLQVRQGPRWKRCESIKARFTITNIDGVSPLAGPCARMTAITLQHAIEPNAYSALAAAQKQ